MKEVKQYICEICGTVYAEKESCKACETNHRHPTIISRAHYLAYGNLKSGYPLKLEIGFSDGSMKTYKLER